MKQKKTFKMEVFVIFLAVLALSAASPGVNSVGNPSIFRKMIANCLASNDTVTCLSIEGITALNRAARMAKFEIFPGVSIHIRRYVCGFLNFFIVECSISTSSHFIAYLRSITKRNMVKLKRGLL